MQLVITLLILFVLGAVGIYMLQVVKGIAYVLFLVALGFGIYSVTEQNIVGRSFQPLNELIALKDAWIGKTAENVGQTVEESEGSSLSVKVTQGLKDVGSKSLQENTEDLLPDAATIATSAVDKAAEELQKHPGFVARTKDLFIRMVRGIASLF